MAPTVCLSDGDDEDGPISFKIRSRTTPSKQHQGSSANASNPRPLGSAGGQPNSKLMKRPRLVEDDGDSDGTDSDDKKPLAKLKRIGTEAGAKEEDEGDHNEPAVAAQKIESANLASDKTVLFRIASAKPEQDDDSEDEKPLAMRKRRLTSNASSASRNSIKRRPGDSNTRTSSPLKKAKHSAMEREPKAADAHDNKVPLVPRLTSVEPSKTKPPAKNTSNNKNKSPSSFTNKDSQKAVQMKAKKAVRNSRLSKAVKIRQGSGSGKKWSTLEHNGVMFPPPYKPHGVKMLYNGQPVDLTPEQEEVATMFAVMRDTEYASKETFINNFFTDWRKILGKTHIISKFELCNFTPIYEWHLREKEKKKQMTSEEKKALRDEKGKQEEKYLWAIVDGVKEKVGNFRVEPPGLFRGRGEHPKMGRLKRRIRPNDITINIGKGTPVPVCPIPGESWKEVKHDNTVTWLAFWNDPINQKDFKYVFLAASSSLKGQSDKEKYEKARKLKDHIDNIRVNYTKDFRSKDQMKKQIAVATYLIDKLALRAGNEKDEDEADTVGCCTLKVENVTCLPPNKLQFDFLGKDSIRYLNTVEVELAVYEAIKEFCAGKNKGDNVFGEIDTIKLNAHLKELMPGLTAKVFRTYNASITLDVILNKETEDGTLLQKITIYKCANKEVAIICNHQRAVSKSHDSQMAKLNEKIDELKAQRDGLKSELEKVKKGKHLGDDKDGKRKKKLTPEMLESKISGIETKIEGMVTTKNSIEESKTVALGTSKINYLDPRITVAWCKTHEIPINKIFSKTILEKFGWAMDVGPDFRF